MKKYLFSSSVLKGFMLLMITAYSSAGWAVFPAENSKSDPAAIKKPIGIDSKNKALAHKHKENELLVKLREGASFNNPSEAARKMGVGKAKRFSTINKTKKSKKNRLKKWWRIEVPAGKDLSDEMTRLSAHPDVEYVEPNYIAEIQGVPNDTHFDQLWGMNNTGQTGGSVDVDIDATQAWDVHTSSDLVVAVIDTGVDYNHEDLADNMWVNSGEIAGNGIDDDGNGYIDDVYGYDFRYGDADPFDGNGHGTHCAGTIAAVGNNNVGVAGVSWSAKIMAVKAFSDFGSGFVSDAAAAITYATNNGADILSNSWGGSGYSQVLVDAISDANDAGILFVAAAGNYNSNNDISDYFPANYDFPNLIAVAAVDHNDAIASFSNYGSKTVGLGAPGVDILSTVPTGSCSLCNASGYASYGGTSMATPHVSGAAALLWSYYPAMTASEIKSHLLGTVDLTSAMANATISGGRLNINAALLADYKPSFGSDLDVFHGSSAVHTLTVTSMGSESHTLNLSLGDFPAGISGSLTDSIVTLPAGGSVTTTVTINADYGMQRGYYPVKVFLQDESSVNSQVLADVRVLVPEVVVDINQSTKTSALDMVAQYDVTLTSIDRFNEVVNLTSTSSDAEITTSTSVGNVVVPEDGTATVQLFADVSSVAQEQNYNISITATNNGGLISDSDSSRLNVTQDVSGIDVCQQPLTCSYSTIQEALDSFSSGATIVVSGGDYNEAITMNKLVKLQSKHGSENTIIDASGLDTSVVRINGGSGTGGQTGTRTVDGFTITGGNAVDGGGVYISSNNYNSGILLKNSVVKENIASNRGGGVYASYGHNSFLNTIFENNSAYNGGGVYSGGQTLVVNDNQFIANDAATASGIHIGNAYGSHYIDRNVFKDNTGSWVITSGSYSTVAIKNALLVNNYQGMVFGSYSSPRIINSTIVGTEGAAINGSYANSVEVSNSILWDNGLDIASASVNYSIIATDPGGVGNITLDPMFIGGGDYRLQPGSPAIDVGKNSGLTTDLNNLTRPIDGDGIGAGTTGDGSDYDIGAYEFEPAVSYLPIADAGPDFSVTEGDLVTLSGTGTDFDGTIVAYAWLQIEGPTVTLSDDNTATPTFSAPVTSSVVTLTFELTVTDNDGGTGSDQISVTVNPYINTPPTANAGADQTVNEQTNVTLTGSGNDSDGTVTAYAWTQVSGTAVTLSGDNTTTATFTAPTVTAIETLIFELTVTDNENATASDQITVTVNPVNAAPSADAGIDQTVNEQSTVSLIGSGTDSDGTIVSYAWVQLSGSAVTLVGANSATPSFTAPITTSVQMLTFELSVTDNESGIATDQVIVTVNPVNAAPSANAGIDQTVNEQSTVSLIGSGADSDGTIVSYAWVQLSGSAVTLAGADSATSSFTAPITTSVLTLTFELSVTDNESGIATDQVIVTVNPVNAAPSADAGIDQTVNEQSTVSLIGSGADSDGTIVSYAWVQSSGPAVTLAGADSATSSFTAPITASVLTLTFELSVTDNESGTATDQVIVTVNPVNAAPTASGLSVTTDADVAMSSMLDAVDSDNDTLTYSIVSNASLGTAVITNTQTGAFTYTPNTGVSGTDSFTYLANDGVADSNVATVSITINDVAPLDSDGDGMPDDWESLYGLNPQDPADGPQDLDGDGISNVDEYLQGSDPTISDVVVSESCNKLWVADYDNSLVYKINADTSVISSSIQVGAGPQTIAVADNHIFVASRIDQTLTKINKTTDQVEFVASLAGYYPYQLSLSGDGYLYVTASDVLNPANTPSWLLKVDPANGGVLASLQTGNVSDWIGIGINSNNIAYLPYSNSWPAQNGLVVVDLNSFSIIRSNTTSPYATGYSRSEMAIDNNGNGWTSSIRIYPQTSITLSTPAGDMQQYCTNGACGSMGWGVTIDNNNNLWTIGDELVRFNVDTTSTTRYPHAAFGGVGYINDHIWTVDGGSIKKVRASDGVLIDTISVTGANFKAKGDFTGFDARRLGYASQCVLPPDSDNDGMTDSWETANGLDPLDATDAALDGDADGLINLEEYRNNTDPANWDTDVDGMADGWEVQYGLNPLDAADATQDLDGDGVDNRTEYQQGSDPTHAPDAAQDVIWIDLVGATFSGNTLSGTTNWCCGGAASQQVIQADGAIELTVDVISHGQWFGLSDVNLDHWYSSIDYGFWPYNDGSLHVIDNFTYHSVGTYSVGDVLRVERSGSTIVYKKNGTVIYTSAVPSSGNLIGDASLYSSANQIIGAKIYGAQ